MTANRRTAALFLVVTLTTCFWFSRVLAQEAAPGIGLEGATISLLASPPVAQAILAGDLVLAHGEQLLFLGIDLNPEWKTYWRLPGRFGFAPQLDWSGSTNLAQARVLFPTPVLFAEGDGQSVGYDRPTLWTVILQARDPDRPVAVRLRLDIGLCAVLCVPERVRLATVLPARDTDTIAPLSTIAALRSHLPQVAGSLGDLTLEQADGRLSVFLPPSLAGVHASGFLVAEDAQGNHAVLFADGTPEEGGQAFAGHWRSPDGPARITRIVPHEGQLAFE